MSTSDIFAKQRPIWREYELFYAIAGRSMPFIVGVIIGGFIFSSDPGYSTNLYTEVLSIIVTVLVLDYLNDRRRKQELTNELKQRLIRNAGSTVNDVAIKAVEELRENEWLEGDNGLLKNAKLALANLQEAPLWYANLQEANLWCANLQGANLYKSDLQDANLYKSNLQRARIALANLQGARLNNADLQKADLESANMKDTYIREANLQDAHLLGTNLQEVDLSSTDMQRANLESANLQGANLSHVNLQNADLNYANLRGANLRYTKISDVIWEVKEDHKKYTATLPDNTKWTSDTEIEKFTNPKHPKFEATLEKINLIRGEMGIERINR